MTKLRFLITLLAVAAAAVILIGDGPGVESVVVDRREDLDGGAARLYGSTGARCDASTAAGVEPIRGDFAVTVEVTRYAYALLEVHCGKGETRTIAIAPEPDTDPQRTTVARLNIPMPHSGAWLEDMAHTIVAGLPDMDNIQMIDDHRTKIHRAHVYQAGNHIRTLIAGTRRIDLPWGPKCNVDGRADLVIDPETLRLERGSIDVDLHGGLRCFALNLPKNLLGIERKLWRSVRTIDLNRFTHTEAIDALRGALSGDWFGAGGRAAAAKLIRELEPRIGLQLTSDALAINLTAEAAGDGIEEEATPPDAATIAIAFPFINHVTSAVINSMAEDGNDLRTLAAAGRNGFASSAAQALLDVAGRIQRQLSSADLALTVRTPIPRLGIGPGQGELSLYSHGSRNLASGKAEFEIWGTVKVPLRCGGRGGRIDHVLIAPAGQTIDADGLAAANAMTRLARSHIATAERTLKDFCVPQYLRFGRLQIEDVRVDGDHLIATIR